MANDARAAADPARLGLRDAKDGLTVGAVAARLGVAPETVRSWGRRYGLTPSGRTAGGHRRFAAEDVERLVRMQRLVADGTAPSAAARLVLADADLHDPDRHDPDRHDPDRHDPDRHDPDRHDGDRHDAAASERDAGRVGGGGTGRGGPGGRVLAVPGASRQARGLARAASRLDTDAMGRILDQLFVGRGAVAAWDNVIRPVLTAAGERWMASGDGIEIEHLLSESVMAACWRHQRLQPAARPGRPVLLACFPEDLHVLPLYVLAGALAEQRVPTRQLGARVPVAALVAATRRTGASAVFVWRQIALDTGAPVIALPTSRPPVRLVVGGPGWAGAALDPATVLAADLGVAVRILSAAAHE